MVELELSGIETLSEIFPEPLERGKLYEIDRITDMDFDFEFVGRKKYNKFSEKREYISYANVPLSFDIEASSFRNENGEAVALMYAWAFNIDGYVFYGRYWYELKEALNFMSDWLNLGFYRRVIVYVHNLAYDFQFFKKHFNFIEVKSNGAERKIMLALTDKGIEFRCSYMLSNSSLDNIAKNLTRYNIKKMIGDLDYNLIRTPKTPLTEKEKGYLLNDVVILEYYIRESMIENKNNILNLPLTSTGYVRRYVRGLTIYNKDKKVRSQYRFLMGELTLEPEEYIALKKAFAGGFTHANAMYSGKTVYDVKANDFASSYPARMFMYMFPMSKGRKYVPKSKEDFMDKINRYCALFYVRFRNINRRANEGYISESKVEVFKGHHNANNGRIESAEEIRLWMTDVDFRAVQLSYEVEDYDVVQMYLYKRGYLPSPIIEAVLKLYEDKTKLKGVTDKIAEYKRAKAMINAVYGMMVTDIVRDEYEWNDSVKASEEVPVDVNEAISQYNESKTRFLFYPWGVWITAYARYDLFKDVVALGDNYIYCDTDSIYYKSNENSEKLFASSNERIIDLLKRACHHHNIPFDRVSPKSPDGKPRTLGIWSKDGEYSRFKTLGAKRYMVEYKESGNINITVSGVNKTTAVPWLKENYADPFDGFKDGLIVPEGACGKSTHTYVDDVKVGTVTDYLGNVYDYETLSGIHLEETSYSLTISNEYAEFIEWLQNGRPLR